jgi:hypothetical protein
MLEAQVLFPIVDSAGCLHSNKKGRVPAPQPVLVPFKQPSKRPVI